MAAFLIYIIKSTVYLALFHTFFLLVMRRTTFFRLNRWMLLAGTVTCMLLPFYTLTVSEVEGIQLPMQVLDSMLASGLPAASTPEGTDIPAASIPQVVETQSSGPTLLHIGMAVYLIGAMCYLFIAFRSFYKMWRLIHAFPKQWTDGCWLVVIPGKFPSFSWNNYIVLSEEDHSHHPSVWVHERTHVRCHHSWDLMFFTLVNALHWFNPLVWLTRSELQQLHEFEADEGVIKQGIDATQYQLLLVRKAVGNKLYSIANGFNHTKLKKRITMMLQEKTNGWERLKWLVAVPVVAGAMLFFASPEEEEPLPLDNVAAYTAYFQNHLKQIPLTGREAITVHSFNVNDNNLISFDGKQLASAADIAPALASALQHTGAEEKHFIGVAYEHTTDEEQLCAYLKEIKDLHQRMRLTPLVVVSALSSYASAGEAKRYTGIEVTLQGEQILKNFTADELKSAVRHQPASYMKDKFVKVGFRATREQTMEKVNEVRRMLKELYAPQEVIFRQSVWK